MIASRLCGAPSAGPTASAVPPRSASTVTGLAPKPRASSSARISAAADGAAASASTRRRCWRSGCSSSSGRPTRLTTSTSSSGQPSRAAASDTDDGWGSTGDMVGAEDADEGGADAVEHRVTACQHHERGPAGPGGAGGAGVRLDQIGKSGQQRARQRDPPPGHGIGQQRELPRGADENAGLLDRGLRSRRQPGPPVGPDADNGHGLGEHALQSAALMWEDGPERLLRNTGANPGRSRHCDLSADREPGLSAAVPPDLPSGGRRCRRAWTPAG